MGAVQRLRRLVGERHHVAVEYVHHVTRLVVGGGVQAGAPATDGDPLRNGRQPHNYSAPALPQLMNVVPAAIQLSIPAMIHLNTPMDSVRDFNICNSSVFFYTISLSRS